MTRRASFPDFVTARRRVPATNTARNNQTFTDVDQENVPARIDTAAETEDIVERNRATETLQVITPAVWMGQSMALAAIDALVIGGHVYELIGNADLSSDHAGRSQNVTITCRRIVG